MLKKYQELSIQTKATIWFVFCSMIQKGIAFITVPIFTRIMSTNDYGIYSIYVSWFQILTIITSLYLYYGVLNTAMVKYEEDRDKYISSMQSLTILLTVAMFIIYIIFHKYLNYFIGLTTPIIVLMFIQMLVDPAKFFWAGKKRFEYKYKSLVVITILQSVLNPLLGIVFVLVFNNDVLAKIMSIVIVELLFGIPIMIILFCKGKKTFSKEYWKFALVLAIPLVPHYLSSMILNQGDRIMIGKLVSNSAVAIYSIAYSIGMVAQIFTNAIINSYTPTFFTNLKNNKYKENKSITIKLMYLIMLMTIIISLFAPELIKIFGTKEYFEAVYVVPPISASVFFIFSYNIFAVTQFYYEKTYFLMISSILSAIINIILNYIFIKMFGYIAAGYTTLFCYIIYSIGHLLISSIILQKNGINDMYNKKYYLIISIITILFNLGCSLFYNNIIYRYILLFVIITVIIIKRNIIKKLISKRQRKEK